MPTCPGCTKPARMSGIGALSSGVKLELVAVAFVALIVGALVLTSATGKRRR